MTLDLNLIVSLNALLEERSVTRAARRLGLSQPTLSAALSRLRRHFDDELLSRTGNAYELTPLGERLVEQTEQALTWTDRVFQTRPEFDPLRSDRGFTIVVADCHLPVFGRALADVVAVQAPNVRLAFQHSTAQIVHGASEHLRNVDAIVLPQGVLANMPNLHLYRDRWVCVAATDSGGGLPTTAEELSARPWVVAYEHPFSTTPPMPRLLTEGVGVRATVVTEDFLAVPHLVAGTDRIGLMPERVARLNVAGEKVAILQLPFEVGHLVESLWWHPIHERDPAHIWLRHMASQVGKTIEAATGAAGSLRISPRRP